MLRTRRSRVPSVSSAPGGPCVPSCSWVLMIALYIPVVTEIKSGPAQDVPGPLEQTRARRVLPAAYGQSRWRYDDPRPPQDEARRGLEEDRKSPGLPEVASSGPTHPHPTHQGADRDVRACRTLDRRRPGPLDPVRPRSVGAGRRRRGDPAAPHRPGPGRTRRADPRPAVLRPYRHTLTPRRTRPALRRGRDRRGGVLAAGSPYWRSTSVPAPRGARHDRHAAPPQRCPPRPPCASSAPSRSTTRTSASIDVASRPARRHRDGPVPREALARHRRTAPSSPGPLGGP